MTREKKNCRIFLLHLLETNLLICSLIRIPQVSDTKLRNCERPPLQGDEIWREEDDSIVTHMGDE